MLLFVVHPASTDQRVDSPTPLSIVAVIPARFASTRFPGKPLADIAGASYWLVGAPISIALGVGLHMQGLGIWIGLAFGLLVAAAAMCWRFWYLSRER